MGVPGHPLYAEWTRYLNLYDDDNPAKVDMIVRVLGNSEYVALSSNRQLVVVEGAAGAGKTTTLAAARAAVEQRGGRLRVVTPTRNVKPSGITP